MTNFAQVPYGSSYAGISLNYGDAVPPGSVGLAYVQTGSPQVLDTIDIEDDLADRNKYAGNNYSPQVRVLQFTGGQLFDPETNNLWVAPTDNVLLTTVAAPYTDPNGVVTQIPLFYKQRLRFGLLVSSLSPQLQSALAQGLFPASTYYPSASPLDNSLVSITQSSGAPLPTGYLYKVMPAPQAAGSPYLYLDVYTNFKGSPKQSFTIGWGEHSETLNVYPVYFQSINTPGTFAYLAQHVVDNSIGALSESATISSGSSISTIVSQASGGSSIVGRSAPVHSQSNPSITSQMTNQSQTGTIGSTTDHPYYINGPSGYIVRAGQATQYTTSSSTTAPTNTNTQLSLNLTTVSCSSDTKGQSYVKVTLLDPNMIPVKTWNTISAATIPALVYYDSAAIGGIYTWQIQGIVDNTLGVAASVPAGEYDYTVTWQGSHGYYIPLSISYTNVDGAVATFSTPSNTVAPAASGTEVSLNLQSLSVPIDPFGSTSYAVTLTDPTGSVVYSWSGISATQNLAYFNVSAVAGSYLWTVKAVCTNSSQGISTYSCSLTGTIGWYVSIPGTTTLYANRDGTPATYVTAATTLAPISSNTKLSLILASVNVQSDSHGASSVKVTLANPNGTVVSTWTNIVNPITLTYSNLAAINGAYTWSVYATCTNNGTAISTYTDTWTGSHTWYQPDPSSTGNSLQQRPIGFTFAANVPDGTVYGTFDSGPQIRVEEPDSITALDNWYLRIHRGWLSFTDTQSHTYLVGCEPYYQQNFDGVIPVISNNRQLAKMVDNTTIQVKNTPIYVSPDSEIDVIITRRGVDSWITRDNGQASGSYVAESIKDINGQRGQLTISSPEFFAGDTIHVSYPYLEYSYVYRGFPDAFGRFIHLDVNPSGGHTWSNLWNIDNVPDILSMTDQDYPSITSTISNVATPVGHVFAATAASSTAVITSGTQSSTADVAFSQGASDTITGLSTSSQTVTPTAISQVVTDQTTAAISAVANPPVLTPVAQTQSYLYQGTVGFEQVPTVTTVATTATSTLNNVSYPTVTVGTTPTLTFTPTTLAAETLTISVSCTASVLPIDPKHAPPDDAPTPIYRCKSHETVIPTWNVSIPVAPVDTNSQVVFNTGSITGGIDSLNVTLTDPSGNVVKTWNSVTPGQDLTYYNIAATTGTYILSLRSLGLGAISADGNPADLTGTYSAVMTPIIKSPHNVNVPVYGGAPGVSSTLNTTVSRPPNNSSDAISLAISSVVLPNDSNGQCIINAQLTSPTGHILVDRHDIVSNSTISYWANDPTLTAGIYTWTVWISATNKHQNSATYTASATLLASWKYDNATTTYVPTVVPADAATYFTGTSTAAPTSSNTQIGVYLATGNPPNITSRLPMIPLDITYNIELYDPNANLVASAYNQYYVNQPKLIYSHSNALPGQYMVKVWASGDVAGITSDQIASSNLKVIYTSLDYVTHYSYVAVPGLSTTFITNTTTVAPTSSGTKLSFTMTQISTPADTYGTSFYTVVLLDPSGNQIGFWNNITSVPGSPFTYYDAAAVAGSYTWNVYSTTTPTGIGSSSYNTIFTGSFGYTDNVTSTTYNATSLAGHSTVTMPAGTLTPTTSPNQLSFSMGFVRCSVSQVGSCHFQVGLYCNSVLVQNFTTTTPTTFTYWNAAAPSGTYVWQWALIAQGVTGNDTYTGTFQATAGWKKTITSSSTVYTEADGTAYNVYAPHDPAGTAIAPTNTATQLSLALTSVVTPSDANGVSSFTVKLYNPSSVLEQTWTNITAAQTLTYFNGAAIAGRWLWTLTATASNTNTGASTYVCTAVATVSWIQTDSIPTTFYTNNNGAVHTYTTSPYTVAPQDPSTQFSIEFPGLVLPADQYGTTQLLIKLYGPGMNLLQTYSVQPSILPITYFQANAVSGRYTITIQPKVFSNNTGNHNYTVYWSGALSYQHSEDINIPTSRLVQKSLYMYMTIDGYPFHAALDPLNDSTKPLTYDTNNAMAGTRYAAMPTIHAF